jgi:hypothetical protein
MQVVDDTTADWSADCASRQVEFSAAKFGFRQLQSSLSDCQ